MSEPATEKPEECECCQFETAALSEYRPNVGSIDEGPRWICDLCAGTMTSTFDSYPSQHGPELHVMKTICYVGNVILKALATLKEPQ